jgi:hypothetical protein
MTSQTGLYTLDFVNKGEPFKFPRWTVTMHESALSRLCMENPKVSDDEKENLFRYYVIHESLLILDKTVSLEEVKSLHPENLVELFNAAYTSGKRDIYFRKG